MQMAARISRRRFHFLASATALGIWAGPRTASAEAAERIRIGLPVPKYTPCSVVMAAQDLGLYKKNGVSAEITAFGGGNTGQEALIQGAIDMIIYFPASVALAVNKGVKEKIVGVGEIKATGWHLMVANDSPIKTVKELDGKNVGVGATGGAISAYMLWIAHNANIQVRLVPVGPAGLIPSLKQGKVYACLLHSGLALPMLAHGGARSIYDLGVMEPSVPDAWVAPQSLIDSNPKVITAALRSIYEATDYMQKNRAFAIDYLKKFTGDSDEKLLNLEYDVLIKAMPTTGKIDRKWLEFSLQLGRTAGMTNLAPVDQIYTDKFANVSAS
jgi:NitT/TauT family transport system substrate-binding protein